MKALSLLVVGAVMSVAGCGISPALQAPAQFGSAHLVVKTAEARSVQYAKGDVHAIKVTLSDNSFKVFNDADAAAATDFGNHYDATTGAFSFDVTGLKFGTNYTAKVEAFSDAAGTDSLGSVTSGTFTATAAQPKVDVTFASALKLKAYPTGDTNSSSVTIEENETLVSIN